MFEVFGRTGPPLLSNAGPAHELLVLLDVVRHIACKQDPVEFVTTHCSLCAAKLFSDTLTELLLLFTPMMYVTHIYTKRLMNVSFSYIFSANVWHNHSL